LVGDAVGGHSGIQSGLRICSGIGEMRLAWDPPARWRIDQRAPDGLLTLLSTPDGNVRCRVADPAGLRCVPAETNGAFGSLVDPPALTLDEIGAPLTVEAERTLVGIRSECFVVEGGPADAIHRAEWCYSGDGLLLFRARPGRGGSREDRGGDRGLDWGVRPGLHRAVHLTSDRLTRAGSLG
jgi:hypothetical protein